MTEDLMNKMWDTVEEKSIEGIRKATDKDEIGKVSIMMLQTSMMGKNAHIRNGARRILMAVIEKVKELGDNNSHGGVTADEAYASLKANMEDEDAKQA